MTFGPDRNLYVSIPFIGHLTSPQNLGSLLGKVLRLTDQGKPAPGNPFMNTPGARKEIFSLGHKDIYGLDFQPGSNKLYGAEHGPSGDQYFEAHGFDEINVIESGRNYGFSTSFGPWVAAGTVKPLWCSTDPVPPGDAEFYQSDKVPQWKGGLLVTSLLNRSLTLFHFNGKQVRPERIVKGVAPDAALKIKVNKPQSSTDWGRLRGIGVDGEGNIYVGTGNTKPGNKAIDVLVKLVPK
jgi:quinoprotein glucose dehydrogenase